MAEKQFGSIKRFGARYGRTVKHNLAKVEDELRHLQKCPYCYAVRVKRVANGIFLCSKCKAKFTGRAYSVAGKPKISELEIESADDEQKQVEKSRRKSKKKVVEEVNDEV